MVNCLFLFGRNTRDFLSTHDRSHQFSAWIQDRVVTLLQRPEKSYRRAIRESDGTSYDGGRCNRLGPIGAFYILRELNWDAAAVNRYHVFQCGLHQACPSPTASSFTFGNPGSCHSAPVDCEHTINDNS